MSRKLCVVCGKIPPDFGQVCSPCHQEIVDKITEEELNRSYNVGISSGLEQAGNYVMELSVAAFRHDQEDNATLLKQTSKALMERGRQAHPGVPEARKP